MKRVLSIILALTLAFALLPTFASATETVTPTEPTIFTIDFSEYTTPATAITTNGAKIGPEWTHKAFAGDGWTALLNVSDSTIYASTVSGGTNVKYMVDDTNGDYLGFDILNNEKYGYNVDNGYNTFSLDFELPASGIYDISAGIRNLVADYGYVQMEIDGVDIGKIENNRSGDMNGDANPDEGGYRQEREFSKGAGVALTAGHHTMKLEFTQYTEGQTRLQPGFYDIIFTAVASPAEPEQDEELSDAFDDAVIGAVPNDYIAPSVDAIDATGIVGEPVPVSGGAYAITAPETAGERGNFLYWKKAMSLTEKIVSFERKFNYVPESKGRNILVAVYEGDVASTDAKCYNANGQYLPDAAPVDADLPSMAGYGKANAWAQYGNTNVYVAQYEAETPIANIDVMVIGDNTSGGGTNLAFGAPVTCKATGENFKCWKKTYGDDTAKIVSRDAEYTFKAWEDCTVEAVYEASVNYTGSTLKIIIDSFTAGDETGVMAEFLGLGNNVVEKGIMFGNNRIAMTTVGNQFSVIADEPGTYKGYVIVEETDGLKLITDGFYEHN